MSDIETVNIPDDIPKLIDIAKEFGVELEEHEGFFNLEQVKFLIYGESGAGKTVFSSSWPDCVFLDIDKGMSSVTRRVARIPISATKQQTAWDAMTRAIAYLESGQHNFKTVVVDSLNEMQAIAMDDILENFPEIRRPYNRLASKGDYGMMLFDFDHALRRLKALPMHVVFVCQVASREYETDVIQPQLTGKNTPRTVARMMDVIGYLYKQEGGDEETSGDKSVRIMIFDAVNHVTKDRSGLLPMRVQNPVFATLYEHWQTQFDPTE